MIVETKIVRLRPGLEERFLARDAAVWTRALARLPGFVDKQVWRRRERPGELTLVIRWRDRASWRAVPDRLLADLEARCRRQVGEDYAVGRALVYEVAAGDREEGKR